MPTTCRRSVLSVVLAGFLSTSVAGLPGGASAQGLSDFSIRFELGGGAVLASYQRDVLGFGFVVHGAGRFAVRVMDPLALQLGVSSSYLPSDGGDGMMRGDGQLSVITGGLRIEPQVSRTVRVFGDANGGVGLTVGKVRLTVELGGGIDWAVSDKVSIGPFVRYSHTFVAQSDAPSDANYIVVGAQFALSLWHTTYGPSQTDRDGDEVTDDRDLCVDVPEGDHPDPSREGCPRPDTDGDGVFDDEDGCPTLDAGDYEDPERRGCPDGDDDNDGVRNQSDACPTQHHGPYPGEDEPGCPRPDRDSDSVPDDMDACPDEPGSPRQDPESNGCAGLVRVDADQIRILEPVFFATGQERILSRSEPVLSAIADALLASPYIRRIVIEGHTDDVGDADSNLELSERRARTVVQDLIDRGVSANRLEAQGLGESRPLVEARTSSARATNRRVEFHIVDPSLGGDPKP